MVLWPWTEFLIKVDVETTTIISDEKPTEETVLEVENAQDIFKKYNISDGEKSNVNKAKVNNKTKKASNKKGSEDLAPFGEEVMANMPMDVQQKFDNFLIVATFSSLTFVVLCGIGKWIIKIKRIFLSYHILSMQQEYQLELLKLHFHRSAYHRKSIV